MRIPLLLLLALSSIEPGASQIEAYTLDKPCGGCQFHVDEVGVLRKVEDSQNCVLLSCSGTLDFARAYITSVAEGTFDGLSLVTGLSLEGNGLTELPFSLLWQMDSLKVLRLSDNRAAQIAALTSEAFRGNGALEEIYLQRNALASLPEGIFGSNPSLKKAYLSGNRLTAVPASLFAANPLITELGLDDNQIGGVDAQAFGALSALEKLYISGNRLASVPDLSSSPKLRRLTLFGNLIGDVPPGSFGANPLLDELYVVESQRTSVEACAAEPIVP